MTIEEASLLGSNPTTESQKRKIVRVADKEFKVLASLKATELEKLLASWHGGTRS